MNMPPASALWVPSILIAVLLSSCARNTGLANVPVSSHVAPPIGWLHGGCIALTDVDVAVDAGVVLISVDEPRQQVTTARILGPTDVSDGCPPLLEDRRDTNQGAGLSFYRIEPAPSGELAIGVLTGPMRPVDTVLDTNGDGRRDTFSQCATAEGIQFNVWADDANHGEPLWSGYYYLGYDMQADCPESPSVPTLHE